MCRPSASYDSRHRQQQTVLGLGLSGFLILSLLGVVPVAVSATPTTGGRAARLPNIILVLTDDLDDRLNSSDLALNATLAYFKKHGTIFENAFATTPVCCPSRSSMLSGLYAHNHKALTNTDDCNGAHWKEHIEAKTIGVRMQRAGYYTAYVGKYLNNLNTTRVPPGWDSWYVQHGNSKYYNFTMLRGSSTHDQPGEITETTKVNGSKRVSYFTSVIQKEALRLLNEAAKPETGVRKPLFAIFSLPAAHGKCDPEPQYARKFANVKAPRTPNFNIRGGDKHWIMGFRETLSTSEIKLIDFMYRRRLQTLLSVDDFNAKLFSRLRRNNLKNTNVFFTSDHGFHLGQFSQIRGKNQPYEEDIRVPFYAVGPGIPKKGRVKQIVLNIDLAPTFLDLAKSLNHNQDMDGMSIMGLLKKLKKRRTRPDTMLNWRTSFLVYKVKRDQVHDFKLGIWGEPGAPDYRPVATASPPPPTSARLARTRRPPSFTNAGGNIQQVSTGQGATLKMLRKYHFPRHIRNITITTDTTLNVTASTVVKLVRWMKNSQCRPIQWCTFEFLRRGGRTKSTRPAAEPAVSDSSDPLSVINDVIAPFRKRRDEKVVELRQPYIPRDRKSRVKRAVGLSRSQLRHLYNEQDACNCTPQALQNHCQHPESLGYDCQELQPCLPRQSQHTPSGESRRCRRAKMCKKNGMSCQLLTMKSYESEPFYYGPDICHCSNTRNSSYWCERRIDEQHNYLFCRFVTNFEEFFDMRPGADPYQLKNWQNDTATYLSPEVRQHLLYRLSYMATCRGRHQCSASQRSMRMTGTDNFWSPEDTEPVPTSYVPPVPSPPPQSVRSLRDSNSPR